MGAGQPPTAALNADFGAFDGAWPATCTTPALQSLIKKVAWEAEMDRGQDFLKSQINNAVMQHRTFLKNLEDHEGQAEDARYRDLCSGFIPHAREHQRMLEDYALSIGAEASAGKKAIGVLLGAARDLADAARESDFLRLVGDIVTSRQSEDTFKTFREAGRALGDTRLAEIGEIGERRHDDYVKQANGLVQQMFVEHVRGDVAPDARMATAGTGTSL